MGRLPGCKGSWRSHFRIARTPPQRNAETFQGKEYQIRDSFAVYHAAIGGFSALMSDKPGTDLTRRTPATTVYGVNTLQPLATHTARTATDG